MITFFNKYGKNLIFSQNSEEGIVLECISRMKPENKVCFEYGCNNGQWCSNTAYLITKEGWSGAQVEYDRRLALQAIEFFKPYPVAVTIAAVTKDNINLLVPEKCFVASFDSDGINDYQCLQALKYCPPILIIEINSGKDPQVDYLGEGASYSAMLKLAIEKGYFLLCHTGNLVLIREDYRHLFPEVKGNGLSNWQEYFQTQWLLR